MATANKFFQLLKSDGAMFLQQFVENNQPSRSPSNNGVGTSCQEMSGKTTEENCVSRFLRGQSDTTSVVQWTKLLTSCVPYFLLHNRYCLIIVNE